MAKKRGPQTKFHKGLLCIVTFLYSEKNYTDEQVAHSLGISRRTLFNWMSQYPELLHTVKAAKASSDDMVEAALFANATQGRSHVETKVSWFFGQEQKSTIRKHYPPDTLAQMFWLRNRRPDKWNIKSADAPEIPPEAKQVVAYDDSFTGHCTRAGYPAPFEKQIEMKEFIFKDSEVPRVLLGSRGYGKTDYALILGASEKIKHDPNYSILIVTKSNERNAAIIFEIAKAARANGVQFEKENSECLRVVGLHGKDHSVSATTIRTKSFRGRHPKLIIFDDAVTEDDVSEATRKQVQRVYNECTKLTPNIALIGQPVHKFDLYETLRPLLEKMEVPHGTIPELDHDLKAMRLAGVSESSIQASYYLKVISETGFPFEHVKYLDKFPGGGSVAFIDPSFKGGDHTAFSAIKGYFSGVAVEGFSYKKAWYECMDKIAEACHKLEVKKLCFETNSLGPQPLIQLRQALPGIEVVGKDSTGFKHSRIMACGPFSQMIHLSKESNRDYLDQVTKYEYGSEPDDAPDSLATGLEWVGLIRGKKV